MKLITISFSICIFLYAPFSTKADHGALYDFFLADSLLIAKSYREAYIEYERIIFKSNDPIISVRAILGKAYCLKSQNEFNRAQQSLERVNYSNLNDSLHYTVRYETALCAYLAGNFTDAESQFVQMDYFIRDSSLLKHSMYLRGLVFNELKKWEIAQRAFLIYIADINLSNERKDSLTEFIRIYYERPPKMLSIKKASILSTLMPGTGQLYAGYPLEGLVNVLLQSSSMVFGFYSFLNKYYITTFTVATGALQVFYFGGVKRTVYLAEKKNNLRVRRFNDKLKDLVVDIETGNL